MSRVLMFLATLGLMTALACSAMPAPNSAALSSTEEAAVAEEVRKVAYDYAAAYSKINCENQDEVLKFFDYSGPGVIDVTATDVTEYPGESWPKLIRDAACSRVSEEATVGKLLVRVLSRDVAAVTSTFQAVYPQKVGPPKRARGALMQVYRRGPDGWKSSVGMSTHEYLPPQ
jgi:hypothetical protein